MRPIPDIRGSSSLGGGGSILSPLERLSSMSESSPASIDSSLLGLAVK